MGLIPSDLDELGSADSIALAISGATFVPSRPKDYLKSELADVTNRCRQKAWEILGLPGLPVFEEVPAENLHAV